MQGKALQLDNILSAAFFFAGKWTPALKRNQSRDLLRFLVCRWYDQGRGKVLGSRVKLAQGTLARKLGVSRQWTHSLIHRLQDAGWLYCYSELLPDGMRGSSILSAGPQLKRLLVMLKKAFTPQTPKKQAVNERFMFSPSYEEKKILSILQKEKEPPSEDVLRRIPLLGRWLGRGGD